MVDDRERIRITIGHLNAAILHLMNAKKSLGEFEWSARIQNALEEAEASKEGLKKIAYSRADEMESPQ